MHINKQRYEVITVGETTVDAFMSIHNAASTCSIDKEHHALCIKHGDKVDVDRYDFCMGGNATNVAVGLSRLGIQTGLCSEIGDDEFSIKVRNWLANERMERLLMKQAAGATSFSVIINFMGDRTVFVQDVQREHNFDFDDIITPYVYLTSLGNEWKKPYKKVLAYVEKNNCRLAFNPGSRQLHDGHDLVLEVLKNTHLLFLNKEEAELVLFEKTTEQTGKEYIYELLEKLQKLGPKIVVITDGQKGSYTIAEDGKTYHRGINDGKVVERTGAGDAYTSGFLAAQIYGLSIAEAMEWGSWNATSVVSKIGAEAGLLKKEAMEEKTHRHVQEPTSLKEDFGIMPAPVE